VSALEDDGWMLGAPAGFGKIFREGRTHPAGRPKPLENGHKIEAPIDAGERLASFNIIRADALVAKQFREPRWAVPDLVPEGLGLLAGKPKTGKSWLALDLGIAVAAGGRACKVKCFI